MPKSKIKVQWEKVEKKMKSSLTIQWEKGRKEDKTVLCGPWIVFRVNQRMIFLSFNKYL